MKLLFITIAALLLSGIPGQGQIQPDENFQQLLDHAGLSFISPLEGRYKPCPVWKNPFQSYDFAIRSRREGIEIRYLIFPHEEGNALSGLPQVRAARLLMHLATNEQEYVMVGRELEAAQLSEDFQADWGMQYFFKPKWGFAEWKHCEMLALHKTGSGTAFVLFLFNEPSRELGHRFFALRFEERPGT